MEVGDGSQIRFWLDKWLWEGALVDFFPSEVSYEDLNTTIVAYYLLDTHLVDLP